MARYLNIEIPDPCHEDWEKMTLQERGRYCNSCKKTVTDFTLLTNPQIIQFLKNNKENICGRFYDDQLAHAILIPRKEIPWLRYFFTITIPAFLFSMKATAQKQLNEVGIVLKDKRAGGKGNTVSQDKTTIQISNNKLEDTLMLEPIVINANQTSRTGRIVLGGAVSYSVSYNLKSKKSLVDNNKKPNSISIFPNPIAANSKMNISWLKQITEDQIVEIFNTNGQLIQKEMIGISFKTNNASIYLKNLHKGFYVIVLTNMKNGGKVSKEFIVL